MIYFSSDWHFWHAKILSYDKLRGNKFKDIETHDEYIIEKLNSTLKEWDSLYFLGDLGMCNHNKVREYVWRIQCKDKYRILGNHDIQYKNRGIEELFKFATTTHLLTAPWWIPMYLSHYPPMNDRWKNYDVRPGTIYIHGHTHRPKWTCNLYDISYNGGQLLYSLDEILDNYVTNKPQFDYDPIEKAWESIIFEILKTSSPS